MAPHTPGYVYLGLFCVLRIAADGLGISNRNSDDKSTIIVTQSLGSAGLSPLLLVLAAFSHEAHHYHTKATLSPVYAQNKLKRLRALQAAFHVLSAGGMSSITYAGQKSAIAQDNDDIQKWHKYRKIGVSMMLLAAIVETLYSFYVWFVVRQSKKSFAFLRLGAFTSCTSVGGIFVGIRAVYSVIYTFDNNPDLNPLTGKLVVKVVFVVLVQFIAVALMITGAWVTRDIRRATTYGMVTNSERVGNDMDSTVPLTYQGANYMRGTNEQVEHQSLHS
ncbi:hypothetical protein B0T10DRAFT_562081 [Thelonectria olida]|uniref:DUF7702 domain-containing protein n=1 Tax=Thelonectria olida TaxID=1576542 RepID=A0A9P9ALB6_9HYPO|nr:hypothetical protein B0T10DRAFT_562081 [Thelonectria olida]